jgi:hypothetical protein
MQFPSSKCFFYKWKKRRIQEKDNMYYEYVNHSKFDSFL